MGRGSHSLSAFLDRKTSRSQFSTSSSSMTTNVEFMDLFKTSRRSLLTPSISSAVCSRVTRVYPRKRPLPRDLNVDHRRVVRLLLALSLIAGNDRLAIGRRAGPAFIKVALSRNRIASMISLISTLRLTGCSSARNSRVSEAMAWRSSLGELKSSQAALAWLRPMKSRCQSSLT